MTRDSQGVQIWKGDRVAFNRSGEVHPGVVADVLPQVQVSQWHTKDDIRIKTSDGRVSRVRNGASVLVLEPAA